jgi:hypothetical protein
MMNNQLELSFDHLLVAPSPALRHRRASRAQWWFDVMRQIVDRACDWEPAAPPRPEQIWFNQPSVPGSTLLDTASANQDSRQICA